MKKVIYLIFLMFTHSSSCMLQRFLAAGQNFVEAGVALKDITTHAVAVMENSTSLHAAITADRVDDLELVRDVSEQINSQDSNKHTPLHLAARKGNMGQIRWLLDRKARVDLPDKLGQLPLHLAVIKGHVDAAKKLIEVTKSLDHQDFEGRTAVYLAVTNDQFEIMKSLLRAGARADLQDTQGNTILYVVIKKGVWKFFKALTVYLPELIQIENEAGETALHTAAAGTDSDIFTALVEKANIECCTRTLWTPLYFAVHNNQFDRVKALMRRGAQWDRIDSQQRSPLCVAAQNRDTIDILIYFLENKHVSQDPQATPVLRALESRNLKALEELLKRKIDKDRRYQDGKTALHFAIEMQFIEAIKLFKEQGVALDTKDDLESTPLAYAVKTGNEPIIALLNNKTQATMKDKNGFDVMYYAVKHGKLTTVSLLATHFPQLGAWNIGEASLLHFAAFFGHSHLIGFLISKGIPVNKRDKNSETPLHFAVIGLHDSMEIEKYKAVIQILLRNNIDRTIKNTQGHTAADLAQQFKLELDLLS